MRKQPLWITGVGCLSAAGIGLEETCATFFRGASAGALDGAETAFHRLEIPLAWRERFDFPPDGQPTNLFALLACAEALAMAGIHKDELAGKRVGVCLGSTVGGTNYEPTFNSAFYAGELPPADHLFRAFHTNSAQLLSRYYGWRGPVQMINNACTSGADAIGLGASWLRADLCDLVICGGTEQVLDRILQGFRSLMLCSAEPCRPFDRDRRGLNLGEGAGIVLLERPGSPRVPLAHFLGYGCGGDALHPTAPDAGARGLDLAVRTALAGDAMNKIDFINAHGTATSHNDGSEGRWVAKHCAQARLVATKGYTGHTLGAAGALEAVFTVLSLMTGKLPASRGFRELDPEIGFAPTTTVESGAFDRALSFSLGFGGINSALYLGKAS